MGTKLEPTKSIESVHGVPPVNARHHHFTKALRVCMEYIPSTPVITISPWPPARLRWRWSTDASEFGGATFCIMRHARSIHRHGSFNSRCSSSHSCLPLSRSSFFPLFFPLFHHASSSLSQTLWLYFGWELSLFEFGNGALFILCLHYVLRQCTRVSGVLFLCAYLYGATCQSTQTLSLCSGWELSSFWNFEMVHWWCYAALRASSMYLYMWSYFPVCFPHFFTCLHYASLSIANAMPLFWLGIVAIWILERCIFHLILCLPCVDNVPEPLHRTMYLYLHLWSQLRAVILTLGRHLNFVKGALFVHWQWICAAALDRSPYAPVVENFFHA